MMMLHGRKRKENIIWVCFSMIKFFPSKFDMENKALTLCPCASPSLVLLYISSGRLLSTDCLLRLSKQFHEE